jgi:hypothetical protein
MPTVLQAVVTTQRDFSNAAIIAFFSVEFCLFAILQKYKKKATRLDGYCFELVLVLNTKLISFLEDLYK